MSQSYKVFVNNFFILITSDSNALDIIQNNSKSKKSSFKLIDSSISLVSYITDLLYVKSDSEKCHNIHSILSFNLIYVCENPKDDFDQFILLFNFIIAAGGLVQNSKEELLMIFKYAVWDLPKGHVNQNESFELCAVREVQEETGVKNLTIMSSSISTYHIYAVSNMIDKKMDFNIIHHDKLCLKETKWFLMKTDSDYELIPQYKEGITKARWIPLNRVLSLPTHSSIVCLLKNTFKF